MGLQDKSRAPQNCPHKISAEVEAALLEAKRSPQALGNGAEAKVLPSVASVLLARVHPRPLRPS